VTNFEAAKLAIESQESFDLILLDHRLPRADLGNLEDEDFSRFSESLEEIGYSLIPTIREHQPAGTIVGTSSMSRELKDYPHKPDETLRKVNLYNPEEEFEPMLRRLIGKIN